MSKSGTGFICASGNGPSREEFEVFLDRAAARIRPNARPFPEVLAWLA